MTQKDFYFAQPDLPSCALQQYVSSPSSHNKNNTSVVVIVPTVGWSNILKDSSDKCDLYHDVSQLCDALFTFQVSRKFSHWNDRIKCNFNPFIVFPLSSVLHTMSQILWHASTFLFNLCAAAVHCSNNNWRLHPTRHPPASTTSTSI